MRKLTMLLCAVVIFCTAFTLSAHAASPQYGSITVTYSAGEAVFPDLEINAYHIADYNGYFELTDTFSSYPVNISNVKNQQEWKNLATTLEGYIYADSIPSDCMIITDEDGVVIMDYMDVGLYLILGVTANDGYTVYEFEPFFTYLPNRQADGSADYDIEVTPKWSSYIPQTDYSVVKLWNDTVNSKNRPQQVEVEIYKNGTLWQSQILDSTNNWRYSWQADADDTKWSVAEKNVPDGYSVSVTENNGMFSVVNSYAPKPNPDTPNNTPVTAPEINIPDTGDTSSTSLYTALMCISGLLLLILGVYRNRNNNEEK